MSALHPRLPWIIAAVAGVFIFVAFTVWGGVPPDEQAGAFWAQIGFFFAVICAFVGLTWHLLVRPLNPGLRQAPVDILPLKTRQMIALLLTSGGIASFIGAFWDELWHRSYGIPFGEDFFWRPHLLMYFGFGASIVTGAWALYYLNRHLRGNMQQRLRSNIIIALLILNAAFLAYALPADPLWHWTFSEDLTAWSIPHLILLASFVMTLTIAFFVTASTVPERAWSTLLRLGIREGLSLLIIASMLLVWLQLMLSDWDSTLTGIRLEWLGLYRPEWLLAANVLATATFCGVIAARVLRCAGAATASGLLALAIRYALIHLFEADMLQYVAWVVALLPLLAIDIWAFYSSAIRRQEPDWRGAAVAVSAAMLINLPVLRALYRLNPSDGDNLSLAVAVIVTGAGMSWLANQLVDAMRRMRATSVAGASEHYALKPAVTLGVLGGFLGLIYIFIVTASPPV